MRKLLIQILNTLTRITLLRYRPLIVAITGSVGKTSTKDAVATVIASKYSVRSSFGNYNNEIGLPLAVINEKTGGRNGLLWVIVLLKAFLKLIYTNYPQVLVLELGTDRPGDIAYLVDILGRIDVAIITDIGISHLEFFAHPQELMKEKLSLIKKLPKDAMAILNFDNPKVLEGKNQTKAEVIGYGFSSQANLMISDFQIIDANGQLGANFKIHHRGTVVPFFLPNCLGKPSAYAAAAAVAAGLRFHIDLASASGALRNFTPPPGRLHLISGIKHTQILDDTYNSAPDSVAAALETLSNIAHGRKMAVLGDMAELGKQSEPGHREVAAKIMENQMDVVFLVGHKSQATEDELKKRKFAGRLYWFADADAARLPIQNAMVEGDTILVKGSQSMRMEKIVKEIMAEPLLAQKILVRQGRSWV
ncbi:MAG: UDP-N-acetylmuramoyl-tripeptide--D-alanyl-D-alanine ligase [Candidatus Doudnabacteria bacterium]|nr:UDP-N-acetylmuramoyl-tripeptide--D-alanyl-D-alanine ligase [Candidatus Doudnabacteria bacterium]